MWARASSCASDARATATGEPGAEGEPSLGAPREARAEPERERRRASWGGGLAGGLWAGRAGAHGDAGDREAMGGGGARVQGEGEGWGDAVP